MIGTAWSLLPPIVAIALALKTKEVYSSLLSVSYWVPFNIAFRWEQVSTDSSFT